MRVSQGISLPTPENSWANTGITFQRISQTTPAAMVMTAAG